MHTYALCIVCKSYTKVAKCKWYKTRLCPCYTTWLNPKKISIDTSLWQTFLMKYSVRHTPTLKRNCKPNHPPQTHALKYTRARWGNAGPHTYRCIQQSRPKPQTPDFIIKMPRIH